MRLGLLGAGSDARLRAACYDRLPEVTVAGVVASDADANADWADATVEDLDALLARARIDAVDVVDPWRPQREIVDRCLADGVGVVCRTPLADNLASAVAIRDAAEGADAPVVVDALHRLARENRDANERVADGEIGDPTTVRTTHRLPTVDVGGDVADELAGSVHDAIVRRALYPDVARTRWLFGDVERVFTRPSAAAATDAEDESPDDHRHAVALAHFASGATGHFDVRVGDRHDAVGVAFEYSGTEGRIAYDSDEFDPLVARAAEETDSGRASHRDIGVGTQFRRPRPSRELYERHAERVVACLRGEAEPPETVGEAVETLRTVEAGIESAYRDAPVAVGEVRR